MACAVALVTWQPDLPRDPPFEDGLGGGLVAPIGRLGPIPGKIVIHKQNMYSGICLTLYPDDQRSSEVSIHAHNSLFSVIHGASIVK